jgi:5'(3')-deoxyribonucleotidase
MKFFEITNDLESRPVVYIDMDGVLADMFGQVAKHHGVDHWRKARKVHNRIDKVAKTPGFFKNLKPLANAGKLLHGVIKLTNKYSILSSPLLANMEQSVREKTEWLEHHLHKNPPASVIFDHEKFKYAKQADGTPNILIDDWSTNIKLWEANGGIGILYSPDDCDRAIRQLKGALEGKFKRTYKMPLAVLQKDLEKTNEDGYVDINKNTWTNKEVLKYVKGIHDEYSLDEPILAHKFWELRMVPTTYLSSPENYDQDDPYRRVIDLDWDHIKNITRQDILNKPSVADAQGWVLDGNHRVAAARAANIKSVPVLMPKQ